LAAEIYLLPNLPLKNKNISDRSLIILNDWEKLCSDAVLPRLFFFAREEKNETFNKDLKNRYRLFFTDPTINSTTMPPPLANIPKYNSNDKERELELDNISFIKPVIALLDRELKVFDAYFEEIRESGIKFDSGRTSIYEQIHQFRGVAENLKISLIKWTKIDLFYGNPIGNGKFLKKGIYGDWWERNFYQIGGYKSTILSILFGFLTHIIRFAVYQHGYFTELAETYFIKTIDGMSLDYHFAFYGTELDNLFLIDNHLSEEEKKSDYKKLYQILNWDLGLIKITDKDINEF
jgi:hypothetical protein